MIRITLLQVMSVDSLIPAGKSMNSRIEFAFRTLARTFYMCDTIYDAGELVKEATFSKMEQVQNFVYYRLRNIFLSLTGKQRSN